MDHLMYILSHLNEIILPLINWLGPWSYVILFFLIFMETGLVVFPWLPGQPVLPFHCRLITDSCWHFQSDGPV